MRPNEGRIGDVVIDKTYNKKGSLAVVVGTGISQPIVLTHNGYILTHNGYITMDRLVDRFSTWEGLEVIGHIDFEQVWKQAERIKMEVEYD